MVFVSPFNLDEPLTKLSLYRCRTLTNYQALKSFPPGLTGSLHQVINKSLLTHFHSVSLQFLSL